MASLIKKMDDYHHMQEIGNLIKSKTEVPKELLNKYLNIDIKNFETEFNVLKDNFSLFLFKNRDLNKIYLNWLNLNLTELDKEKIQMIENIILNIHDILEN